MGKDPKKPRGKMSSYAYFVQTCREEHKKKHPEASVNFAEFSKKCSERWKVRDDQLSKARPLLSVLGPHSLQFDHKFGFESNDMHFLHKIFQHVAFQKVGAVVTLPWTYVNIKVHIRWNSLQIVWLPHASLTPITTFPEIGQYLVASQGISESAQTAIINCNKYTY